MSRAGNEFGGPAKERSGWLIPLAILVVIAVLAGLTYVFYFAPTPSELIEEQAAPTGEETSVTLTVGSQTFHIPANYIPFASARKGGSFNELKLIALLPDLKGYSPGEASAFAADNADSHVLDMRLRARVIADERSSLDRIILPQVTDTNGKPGPFGLTQYSFRENSSYRNQELFVGQSDRGPVVMRCTTPVSDSVAPSCVRDQPIAPNVAFRYSFKRAQLENWRDIDTRTRQLFDAFMKK